MIDPLAIEPRVTWGVVVESNDDKLVNLFKDSNYEENICCEDDMSNEEDDEEVLVEEDEEEESRSRSDSEYSWNSDKDNFIDLVGGDTHLDPPAWGEYCEIMGFHPHKYALILVLKNAVVAYHLDTSRMQYLGKYYELMKDHVMQACDVYGSFPYRPCYVDVLPPRKSSVST